MAPATTPLPQARRRRRFLTGHSIFFEDIFLSSNSQFALSGCWDGELRFDDLHPLFRRPHPGSPPRRLLRLDELC
ncbi:hypothetical protein TIFTF001_015839 [Ficus carica]|uniref:Uncharacterized protein n=1 Tax=Ficus carica TaxID=3494 RepID=A0AA88A570_FICCA|nr:hypothetical protein TIFTF001_015839 [Ficus carica]